MIPVASRWAQVLQRIRRGRAGLDVERLTGWSFVPLVGAWGYGDAAR